MTNLKPDDNFSKLPYQTPKFFKSGLIRAVFKDSGTIAWFNDALTILVTIGDNSSTPKFRNSTRAIHPPVHTVSAPNTSITGPI